MKCSFCGEREAKNRISNPNDCSKEEWDVCDMCADYIEAAQEFSTKVLINEMAKKQGMPHITTESLEKEFHEKTKHIPNTMMATFRKKE